MRISFDRMELIASDRNTFYERGILPLRGLISRNQCAAVKRSILAELDRLKLREKGKLASSKIQKVPLFQQTGRLGQMVKMGSELDVLFPEDLVACMSSLANAKLKSSSPHPQLLLSFPHNEDWSVTSLNWHLDLAVPHQDEVPGVQAFILIDDVLPRGGATLALAGSHKLPYSKENRTRSAHGVLRQHPIFGNLYGGSGKHSELFFQPQLVDGVDVHIVEMAGRAGDVFLMDLRVLHAPSVNATKNMRMMATNRFLR